MNKKRQKKFSYPMAPVFLKNILLRMPGSVYWKNIKGVYLGCNQFQAEMAGLESPEEMVGKTDYELPWKSIAPTLAATDQEIMQTKQPKEVIETPTLPDGRTLIMLTNKAPLFDERGKVIGIIGTSIDITKQKEAEQALLEIEHKLTGMTLVATSVAHELRTPLTSLEVGLDNIKNLIWQEREHCSNISLNKDNLNLLKEVLNIMKKEVRSSSLVIDLLLQNLKPQVSKSSEEHFSIHHCIKEAIERFPFDKNQSKLIHWKSSSPEFWIKGSELLLMHVLFNLIKNALYYIAKAGKGHIEIWTENKTESSALYFKDTGTGIKADVLPRIFDQFFSQTHGGTGVGLTQCKRIIESINGQMTCESAEGKYTLFKMIFPLTVIINKGNKVHE